MTATAHGDAEDRPLAVTFDFGQTIARLDPRFLSRRLGERGFAVAWEHLEAGLAPGMRAYNEAIARGEGGHPWCTFMAAVLRAAGLSPSDAGPLAEWLFEEQKKQNLWREPVPGMLELARALRRGGVPVGVLSNSEGFLAELIAELGWDDVLTPLADSGRLGMEKPDPKIFHWLCGELRVEPSRVVHVGDAWEADVRGALGVGMRAVWFAPPAGAAAPEANPRLALARDAQELSEQLRAWGLRWE